MHTSLRYLAAVFLIIGMLLPVVAIVPPRDSSSWLDWQDAIMLQSDKHEQSLMQDDSSLDGMHRAPMAFRAVGTRTLIPRILVITVSFSDFEFTTSQADVDSMFNGWNWTKDGATGSLRQYYHDQSMGQYNPQFDIVGPVTLSQGYAYYGAGVNGSNRVGYMVTEACALVNDSVDFAQYDSDDDGKVDLVYIYYAGFGENDQLNDYVSSLVNQDNLIWPAYWNVVNAGYGSNSRYFDGKYIYDCEYSNELDALYTTANRKVIAGIGTACHEFGHALGLPDMYVTKGNSSHKTLGAWDLMCYGLYNNDTHTPAALSAYERFFLGWLTPTLIVDPDTLTLENIAISNQAYLISENDRHNLNGENPDTTVFYLLENRQNVGWDLDIPGSGMMLTRIDYNRSKWTGNTVNNSSASQGVDIIEADGLTPNINTNDGAFGKPGDLFPAGATEYLGIPDHAIEAVTMVDGIIRFVYRGGAKPSGPETDMCPVNNHMQVSKTIRNGQLIIITPNGEYNTLGLKQD